MEEIEIDEDFHVGVDEIGDGEIIIVQTYRGDDDTAIDEILMTRQTAIKTALIILELTGYDHEEKDAENTSN